MRYNENTEQNERDPYMSDQTAFMRWSTEPQLDEKNFSKELINDIRYKIEAATKFPALANINDLRTIKYVKLLLINAEMAWDSGLYELAMSTVMDIINTYQITRGQGGFYQKALITTRREWEDKTKNDQKKGFFGRLIKNNEPDNERQMMAME